MKILKKKRILLLKKKRYSFQIFLKNSSLIFKGFLGSFILSGVYELRLLLFKNLNNNNCMASVNKSLLIKKIFFFCKNLYSLKKIFHYIFLGCSFGWFFSLEFSGRGFFFRCKKNYLIINLGLSHAVGLLQPKLLKVYINKKYKNKVTLYSINFFKIRNFIFKIRSLKKVDTYKGRGTKCENEVLKLKIGKRGI